MSSTDLARLVRSEGGVMGALDYGVRSTDIADPEIASLWRRIEELYDELRPSLSLAQRLLYKARMAA
jgi:hypothetical protein